MEKKCSQKPSCEDACAAKAKAGAKDNCKKDDKECLAKFKKMAAKCAEEKCKKDTFEKGDCEQGCKDYYTEAAKKSCKQGDQECINKFKKMAAKCVEEKCKAATFDDKCEAACQHCKMLAS